MDGFRVAAIKINFFARSVIGILMLQVSATVVAQPCADVLMALQQERHLSLVKQTEGKQTTEYRDGPNIALSLSCAMSSPNIAITWNGPSPDQAFYDLVGRAGSLVSTRPAADVVKASKQCRKEALKDDSEIATVEHKGLAIECQAFARDGGGTVITVFAE